MIFIIMRSTGGARQKFFRSICFGDVAQSQYANERALCEKLRVCWLEIVEERKSCSLAHRLFLR
jgi:hypothetical protein